MFEKKRDKSLLTFQISTITFTASQSGAFILKTITYLRLRSTEDMCIGLYVLKRLLNVGHILEKRCVYAAEF